MSERFTNIIGEADMAVVEVVDDVCPVVEPAPTSSKSASKYSAPNGQDWFKCLRSCEARGEMCTCAVAEESIALRHGLMRKQQTSSNIGKTKPAGAAPS